MRDSPPAPNHPPARHIAAFKIGVISDTHNYLDPQIKALFDGVAHILHAGDIGGTGIIRQLEDIAPVTAVLGNTDDPGLHFNPTEFIEVTGRRFLLHHIVQPSRLPDWLQERIAGDRPDVVVFGHTHKPFSQRIGPPLFFNPGYAGKSRFDMERTVAILHCEQDAIRPEYIRL